MDADNFRIHCPFFTYVKGTSLPYAEKNFTDGQRINFVDSHYHSSNVLQIFEHLQPTSRDSPKCIVRSAEASSPRFEKIHCQAVKI